MIKLDLASPENKLLTPADGQALGLGVRGDQFRSTSVFEEQPRIPDTPARLLSQQRNCDFHLPGTYFKDQSAFNDLVRCGTAKEDKHRAGSMKADYTRHHGNISIWFQHQMGVLFNVYRQFWDKSPQFADILV